LFNLNIIKGYLDSHTFHEVTVETYNNKESGDGFMMKPPPHFMHKT